MFDAARLGGMYAGCAGLLVNTRSEMQVLWRSWLFKNDKLRALRHRGSSILKVEDEGWFEAACLRGPARVRPTA